MNCEDSYFYSLPIVVEGCAYRLKFYPDGWSVGKGTFISVGVHRTKLTCLDLDTCDAVHNITKMLHPTDHSKDFIYEKTNYWSGKNDTCFGCPEFYRIEDVIKNGFIQHDGSLRFEFLIKKHKFGDKLAATEMEVDKL